MNSSSTINILDIGGSKVQCLITQPNHNGELEVIGYAYRESPTPILNTGSIINIDKTARIVQEAVSSAEVMAGVEVNEFFATVPAVMCEGVSSHGLIAVTPKEGGEKKVTLSDLERVIDIAESTPIPRDHTIVHSVPVEFKVDGMVVDEDPRGMVGMRLETQIYLLTCSKQVLDSLNKVVDTAGYELRDIITEDVAYTEAVLSEEEKNLGSLVINIGGQSTNVVIYAKNGIHLAFSIPWGGDSLTRDLSIGISTGLAEAEEIKRKHGVLDYQLVDEDKVITVNLIAYQKKSQISQKAIYQIFEARMSEILDLVKKGLKESQASLPVGCGIVVTGGSSQIPGIEVITRNIFNLPVRIGTPLEVKGVDPKVETPVFATAMGAAKVIYSKANMSDEHYNSHQERGVLKKIRGSIKNFFT